MGTSSRTANVLCRLVAANESTTFRTMQDGLAASTSNYHGLKCQCNGCRRQERDNRQDCPCYRSESLCPLRNSTKLMEHQHDQPTDCDKNCIGGHSPSKDCQRIPPFCPVVFRSTYHSRQAQSTNNASYARKVTRAGDRIVTIERWAKSDACTTV